MLAKSKACRNALAAMCLAAGWGASAGQPVQVEPLTLLCQVNLNTSIRQPGIWLNVLTSADYRQRRLELYLRDDAMDLVWPLDDRGRFNLPHMNVYIPVALAEGAAGPFSIEVRFDGRLRWQASGVQPNIVRRYAADGRGGTSLMGEFGEVRITQTSNNPFPNLKGVRTFEVVAKSGDGKVSGTFRYDLPDWKWLERETAKAFRAADAAHKARACGPGAIA